MKPCAFKVSPLKDFCNWTQAVKLKKNHITTSILLLFIFIFFLLGLNDKGVESEFKWSDGSNVVYTNWDAWNPDDWASSEDCVTVRNYNDGRWNDQNCDNSLAYICKKPKGLNSHCS